jgi:hypothetical protein
MGTPRVLVALLLAPFACPQQPQNNEFKVEGVVVNSLTGNPLPRVLVQVAGRVALTGSEGEFSFDGIPGGMAQVTAQKPGYFPPGARMPGWSVGPAIEVRPDSGKVTLKLAPEAVITGHVTGVDDEPLEGASVQVLAYLSMNDGPQRLMAARGGARSDEDGNFRIAGLPAGRYYVALRTAGISRGIFAAQSSKTNEAYPAMIYYPGVEDLAAASMVDLAPGQHLETLFSLAMRPAYKVSGAVVTSGEWKQVNPPAMVDSAGQSLLNAETFDAKTGTFEFRAVPAGTYTIRLRGTDAEDRPHLSNQKITVSKPVAGLKLFLKPGINIPVVIRTEFTKPREDTHATCGHALPGGGSGTSDCSEYPAARIELLATDGTGMGFSTNYEPMKDLGVTVRGVLPGKYLVRAQAAGRTVIGGYIQSVRSGGLDLLQEPLVVAESGSVPPIEVVVRDDPAALKVRLRTEKPGQSATVLLCPEGALLLSPMHKMTITTEMYFAPLAPGSYKVFAFDSIDGIDYFRPEALAKYAAQAARVTIAANHESSVIVDVIHTGD